MKTKMIMVKLGVGLLVFVTACSTVQLPSPRPEEPEGVLYTPVPTVVEPGLAYGEPCQPPCWRGIVPGKTTKQEAAQAIDQLRSSGWASYIEEGPKGYAIQPLPGTPSGSIGLLFENDVVSDISGSVTFYYPVGTMIEQFGEPEGLYVPKGNTSKGSCEEWEPPDPPLAPVRSVPIYVTYPNQGLAFVVLVPESGLGLICPEMKVTAFCYYPPLSMQEALKDDYLASLCSIVPKNSETVDLAKWHGFGSGY
jgi:hypothetical protein